MPNLDWSRLGAWPGGAVQSIALSPRFERDRLALAATGAGLFRSADGGVTWQRAGEMGYIATRCVTFAPSGAAFAATQAGALMRSTDGGVRWQVLNAWAFGPINALALPPFQNSEATIFAATDEGIFRSMDGGASWQSANFGLLDVEILCLACAPDFAESEVVWAGSANGGLYRSRNTGRAWREAGQGLPDAAVQCIVVTESDVFAGTESGLFRLANGATWLPHGLEGLEVNDLMVCDGTLLAGTTGGIFRDAREGWQPTEVREPTLALAGIANGVILGGSVREGIWQSADGGRRWRIAHEGLAAHTPPLAVRACGGTFLLADAVGSMACSEDGVAWRPVAADDPIACMAASPPGRRCTTVAATKEQVLIWNADNESLSPWPSQLALADEDAITALSLTRDGTCLVGTQAGRCKVGNAGTPWHDVVLPGEGVVAALHLTPAGSLFALRLAPKRAYDSDSFSAELWYLPTLVLPATKDAPWQMLMALDGLRVPLACLSVEGDRIVLAAQHVVAQAHVTEDDPIEVRRIAFEAGTAFTAVATRGAETFLASNRGVVRLSDTGAHQPVGKALAGVPVVALSADEEELWAVTLGGEVWRHP